MGAFRVAMLLLFLVPMALVTGGCAKDPGVPRVEKYNEQDFLPYGLIGRGSIEGKAFVKTGANRIQPAASRKVTLVPATPYHREWMERSVMGGERLKEPDTRVRKYSRTVISDMEGNFRFANVPPGRYFIVTDVLLEEYPQVEIQPDAQGRLSRYAVAYAEVEVQENEQKKDVVVTRPEPPAH